MLCSNFVGDYKNQWSLGQNVETWLANIRQVTQILRLPSSLANFYTQWVLPAQKPMTFDFSIQPVHPLHWLVADFLTYLPSLASPCMPASPCLSQGKSALFVPPLLHFKVHCPARDSFLLWLLPANFSFPFIPVSEELFESRPSLWLIEKIANRCPISKPHALQFCFSYKKWVFLPKIPYWQYSTTDLRKGKEQLLKQYFKIWAADSCLPHLPGWVTI